jgi:AcrR family transcriptional regulator
MEPRARAHPRRPDRAADDDARTRVLETSYDLFSRFGVVSVGIDRIVDEAGVAKMSLYRHFPSKRELVIAFLELREERWTRGWLESEIERVSDTPGERLLVLFDVLDVWFRSRRYEGCAFIRTVHEVQAPTDPVHKQAVRHIEVIRGILEELATLAGVTEPARTSYQVQLLMMGAIVSATRGDRDAARRARPLVEVILKRQA